MAVSKAEVMHAVWLGTMMDVGWWDDGHKKPAGAGLK